MGVIQAPFKKGYKQGHRLVVLPDYQGIGIGSAFATFIAEHYKQQGYIMKAITTTPAIRFALDKSKKWLLTRSGKVPPNGNKTYMAHLTNSQSSDRMTWTYVYQNEEA